MWINVEKSRKNKPLSNEEKCITIHIKVSIRLQFTAEETKVD